MIINSNAIKLESNLEPTKALNFGISDVRLVVDILSKLYAYPIRTLVQEYICNGRDAMREAGTWGKQPLDITVPNTLEPTFKVRDYGVGITPDRMENIFVNYGSSTKRNTNAQTGGFGIGAKSAFSYTDSFTVTSFVNGTKYIYLAHLGDNGGVNLLEKRSTTEPNGVEISIGVKAKDITEFFNAVQRCVRFWSEPIKFIGTKNITQINPTLTLGNMNVYSDAEERTIYLIDGIEYPMIEENSSNYWSKRSNDLHSSGNIVAINLPNGFFKIASSRERLENNDDNKQKQEKVLTDCKNNINKVIAGQINNKAKSLEHRLEEKVKYGGFSDVADVSINLGNGNSFDGLQLKTDASLTYRYCRRGRRASQHYELNKASRFDTKNTVIYDGDDSNTTARKLNYYLESNKDKVLISKTAISTIPMWDSIFKTVLDVSTLPLPPAKAKALQKKSARDAICWFINVDGERSSHTIDYLNQSSAPSVIVEELTDDAKELARFMRVVMIPKCNKDLVLKKGMSLEQGRKSLLSSNKNEVVGLSNLPFNYDKVDVLKKFKRKTIGSGIQDFLFKHFPNLKKEHDDMQKEYNDLIKKYPLITVLENLDSYKGRIVRIVIDEINKQSKEN
jgi:hypothetical protein